MSFVVFDLLWLDGRDTTGLMLEERRELLELIVEEDHRLQLMSTWTGMGRPRRDRPFVRARGVVAKRHGSKYASGRRTRTGARSS